MEIIKIHKSPVEGEVKQTVNARDLHSFLEIGKDFSTWMKNRIEQFCFVDGQDYVVVTSPQNGGAVGNRGLMKEYHLTLDMAKELSMVERNDKGKQARRYFIECEKIAKQATQPTHMLPQTLSEALRLAADLEAQREKLHAQIEKDRHKVDFHKAVKNSTSCLSVGAFAKILGTGRNRLFRWMRDNEILMSNNLPYQPHVDAGRFRVIENIVEINGEDIIKHQVLITGKGQTFIQRRWNSPESIPQKRADAT